MIASEDILNRLLNWKFTSAYNMLQKLGPYDLPDMWERNTIEALHLAYGNCGWFEGTNGTIVQAAVWSLGVEDE